jgi:hypothetical protein
MNIVILHLWVLPDSDTLLVHSQMMFKELFFHSSTIYFIFISGFLVTHLKDRIVTTSYYKSKLKNVILPYILISIALLFVYSFFGSKTEAFTLLFLKNSLIDILMGKVNFHFWYIPFITLIFLATPVLLKLNQKTMLYIAPFMFLLPLLGTRTGIEITVGQYLYFFPIYIIGMLVRLKLDTVQACISSYKYWIGAIFLASLITLFLLLLNYNLTTRYPYYFESLFYVNRLMIIFLFIGISGQISYNKYPLIGKIADYSFALYFIHGAIGIFIQPRLFGFLAQFEQHYWIPFSLLVTFCIILLCLFIIRITKLVFGKRSRLLIGY